MQMSVQRQDAQPRAQDSSLAASRAVGKAFFSGVAVLSLSTVLVKIIGLFYKIPMLRYLGSVGMGYFNAAYEWYAMLCVLATAGLPIAVSMLIAGACAKEASLLARKNRIRRIERISSRIYLALGSVGSVAMWLFAPMIANLIDSPLTVYALRAVAPTLFFSCISASYRGYFQGFQNMVPTAISQLIEAVGKLLFGVLFAYAAMRAGKDVATIAAYAMLGLSLGVAIATGYLVVYRARCGKEAVVAQEAVKTTKELSLPQYHTAPLWKQILLIALPITLSSSVLSLTRIVDMAMILRRLQRIGYSTEAANALYGIYTTMAVPVFNLVPALLTSVSLALIPALSAQIARGDRGAQKQTVSMAIRLTALLSLPASMALAIYARPVLSLLFSANEEELATAAPLLSLLALSVVFSGLITTTNAALQAFGYTRVPIASMLVGSTLKLVCAALLISVPTINIMGAPLSTFVCNSVIVGINLQLLYRRTGAVEGIAKTLLQPLIISLLAVGLPALPLALLTRYGGNAKWLFLAAVPLTVVLMLVFSLKAGALGTQEMREYPALARVQEILCRLSKQGRLKNKNQT